MGIFLTSRDSVINQLINELDHHFFIYLNATLFQLLPPPTAKKRMQNSHWRSVVSGTLTCLSPLPVAQGSHWVLCLPRMGLPPSSKQLTRPLLPPGTGCQMLSARCQLHGQAYQPVPGITDFFPPKHTPEGQSAPGWIPSCFRAESYHVQSGVTADFCQGPVDSTILVPSCRASRGWRGGLSDSHAARRDAWPLTSSQPSTETPSAAYSSGLGRTNFWKVDGWGEGTAGLRRYRGMYGPTSDALYSPKYPLPGEKLTSYLMVSGNAGLDTRRRRSS